MHAKFWQNAESNQFIQLSQSEYFANLYISVRVGSYYSNPHHFTLSINVVFQIVVPTPENGEELCIRLCLSFFAFVFHAKSGPTNIDRTRLRDISY